MVIGRKFTAKDGEKKMSGPSLNFCLTHELNLEDKVVSEDGGIVMTKMAKPNNPSIIEGFEPNLKSNSAQFNKSLISGRRIQRREGQESI
ncbi:uncharacterized protein G2W53_000985 [Senna tora]|uniref:Uncharacterized protein n=1 Tax=Senna tora TaxID=362788 RepID=A0A835CL34_9FABA|nr:uncharacterized protein G2W53_000985 [Senna tora]